MRKLSVPLVLLVLSLPVFADLASVAAGAHRDPANVERDVFRHPVETLTFFGVEPDMTVVEIWPGGGWYTEILAPYLKDGGRLYAAHFPADSGVAYFDKVRKAYVDKLEADPAIYGKVAIVPFAPDKGVLGVPENSVDRVLTFRNVHNWLRNDSEAEAFKLFFQALKPGGMLGVVEHRTGDDRDRRWMVENGYMTESSIIALAENAGFELAGTSEINANSKDGADHPKGVWTLPPTLRMGDEDRDTYLAIGESDRMTLLFVKPDDEQGPVNGH